jgi:hypothetical protein
LQPLARLSARFLAVLTVVLVAMGPVSAFAGAQSSPRGVITLTSQDPWVLRSNVPVRLGLEVSSSVPVKDLLVSIALYTEPDQSALASRDEFDATLKGQLAGLNQLSYTEFSLRSINKAHGLLKIYVGGSELAGQVPAKLSSNQLAFKLPCPTRYGGCGGVYPLEVSLDDVLTGEPIDSFTTYLVVIPSTVASQRRLRFSFIVPLGSSLALSATGSPAVDPQTLSEMRTIAGAEARWPLAPLSVDLYGQLLLALERSPKHTALLNTAAYGGLDTLVPGPFSNIDPTRLVRSGLAADLKNQIARGDEVFAKALKAPSTADIYVATTQIGTRGLAALSSDGIKDVVVPEANLQSVTNGQPQSVQWPYTLSAPFEITGTNVEGLQSDPELAAHLTGAGSPSLRAQQLLADLAEIFFDSPDFPSARGVALVAPQSWSPAPGFLAAALHGLSSSPIITAVPIGELFARVPRGTCQVPSQYVTGCSPVERALIDPTLTSDGSVTSAQLRTARAQLAELSSVIPSGSATLRALGDAISLAETAGLRPGVREQYLSAALATMLDLGSQLGLPAGRTVTVTSSSARFPIAITSSYHTPIHAVLAISGTDLASSANLGVVLKHGTTSFIVRVHTRTSGDSSLQLQLLSPVGRLQLARVELTIRSTAISGVAIGLTAGAAAFLFFWWFRSISRRHRRRARHATGTPRKPEPEAVQEPVT